MPIPCKANALPQRQTSLPQLACASSFQRLPRQSKVGMLQRHLPQAQGADLVAVKGLHHLAQPARLRLQAQQLASLGAQRAVAASFLVCITAATCAGRRDSCSGTLPTAAMRPPRMRTTRLRRRAASWNQQKRLTIFPANSRQLK